MNANPINPDWSEKEIEAIHELAELKELPPTEVVRQALRTYQAIAKNAMQLIPTTPPPGCPDLSDDAPEATAPKEFLTDEEIAALFENTRFGERAETPEGRRELMADCVFKAFGGYGDGATIRQICMEARLLDGKGKPTPDGARWTFRQLHGRGSCFEERVRKLP